MPINVTKAKPASDSGRKIRVAHLITNFALGGAQDYLLLVVRGLDRNCFQPIVAGRMEGEWVSVITGLDGVQCHDIPSLQREISLLNDLKAILEIRRFCINESIDILHTHSSKAGVVGRLAGFLAHVKVVVHTVHGFSFNDFMPAWKKRLFIYLERGLSPCTTVLLLLSRADLRTAKKHRIGARQTIEMFYCGRDGKAFDQAVDKPGIRSSLGFRPDEQVVGFTGRISKQKALHILVEAFARISAEFPKARLLIVGDGPLRYQLELQARSLGVFERLTITGFRQDIPSVLAAMDVFVMTSFWEGLSLSLAEAMFAKVPVIATDVGGTSDAIRNGETGWLVPPNDVEATACAIREALANPIQSQTFAVNGYRWAREAFDLQTMLKRIESLYIESLAKATGGRGDG